MYPIQTKWHCFVLRLSIDNYLWQAVGNVPTYIVYYKRKRMQTRTIKIAIVSSILQIDTKYPLGLLIWIRGKILKGNPTPFHRYIIKITKRWCQLKS